MFICELVLFFNSSFLWISHFIFNLKAVQSFGCFFLLLNPDCTMSVNVGEPLISALQKKLYIPYFLSHKK